MHASTLAMLKTWLIIIGVGTILTTPCSGGRIESDCPGEWFTAQFVSIADVTVPSSVLEMQLDTNYSFFRDIMFFTDEEIESATQAAINFFNTKFGLDFSQSSPNELGERTSGSATLSPFVFPPEVQYTVTFNRWIFNGRPKSLCYENRDGGFAVSFSEDQMLFGTYGGQDGKPISPGEFVVYGFYNIPVCAQEPIVIQYNSGSPVRFDAVDGFGIINCELYHHTLGEGIAQGVFRAQPLMDEPGMVHYTIRNLFTFPPNPGLAG